MTITPGPMQSHTLGAAIPSIIPSHNPNTSIHRFTPPPPRPTRGRPAPMTVPIQRRPECIQIVGRNVTVMPVSDEHAVMKGQVRRDGERGTEGREERGGRGERDRGERGERVGDSSHSRYRLIAGVSRRGNVNVRQDKKHTGVGINFIRISVWSGI